MKKQLILFISLSLVLSGCAPATLTAWLDATRQKIRLLSLGPETRSTVPQIEKVKQQKDNHAVLSLLQPQKKQRSRDKNPPPSHSKALNGLLNQADLNLVQGNYFQAGQLYRLLSRQLSQRGAVRIDAKIDPVQLNNRLEQCADQLMEQGLLAYRNGELEQALEIWDKINNFHPQYVASRRAVRTTRLQLRNLGSLPAS